MANNFVICTTQRSGKTWLCSTLQNIGGFGKPFEYIDALHKKDIRKEHEITSYFDKNGIDGILSYIEKKTLDGGKNSNPIAFVIQWNQLGFLEREGYERNELISLLKSKGYTFFLLQRKDVLQQAISQYIHSQSGFAHSYQGERLKQKRSMVEFSAKEILKYCRRSLNSYNLWKELFKENSVEYNGIYYEDMCDDLTATIKDIAIKINRDISDLVDSKSLKDSITLEKVGDDLDEKFRIEMERLIDTGEIKL